MARKTASRLELRRQAEAADAQGIDGDAAKARKKKKTPARKKAKTTRAKRAKDAPQRRRLLWGVFNGSMKEEARFPYDQRDAAEEKLEQLRAKSKKLYFIQPIKEAIAESAPAAVAEEAEPKEAGAEAEESET